MSDIVSAGEEKGQSNTEGNKEHEEQDEAQIISKPEKENSIEDVCDNMLEKVVDYMNGELTATCSDYKLLEKLNRMTLTKYADMSTKTMELTDNLDAINEKYRALQPFLEQIDHLEDGVQKLEAAAYKLDAYSKQLETRFKKLEKK